MSQAGLTSGNPPPPKKKKTTDGFEPMPQQPETTLPGFEVAAVFQRRTGVRPLCHNARPSQSSYKHTFS